MNTTLEQLERDAWGEPAHDSRLVATVHRLRRKPLDAFTNEDLRIMIGQNVGLGHLIPLAMKVLRANPLASGDLHEGDLLAATIRCDAIQQNEDESLRCELADLYINAITEIADSELRESFGGISPEAFGLDRQARESLLQARIEELESNEPWRECRAYLRNCAKPSTDRKS